MMESRELPEALGGLAAKDKWKSIHASAQQGGRFISGKKRKKKEELFTLILDSFRLFVSYSVQ
jgi:hypothetical protein